MSGQLNDLLPLFHFFSGSIFLVILKVLYEESYTPTIGEGAQATLGMATTLQQAEGFYHLLLSNKFGNEPKSNLCCIHHHVTSP